MIDRTPDHVVYTGFDQPDVQVLVDGDWCQGELRSWDREPDGTWTASVNWRRGPGQGNYLERFAADDVRPDLSDHSPTLEA